MLRKVIKKVGVVLLAAGLSIGMFSPSVSAAVKINKAAQMKAAKNVEPEEWNKEELTAYQFDTGDDFLKYMFTGGLHLYNKNYKKFMDSIALLLDKILYEYEWDGVNAKYLDTEYQFHLEYFKETIKKMTNHIDGFFKSTKDELLEIFERLCQMPRFTLSIIKEFGNLILLNKEVAERLFNHFERLNPDQLENNIVISYLKSLYQNNHEQYIDACEDILRFVMNDVLTFANHDLQKEIGNRILEIEGYDLLIDLFSKDYNTFLFVCFPISTFPPEYKEIMRLELEKAIRFYAARMNHDEYRLTSFEQVANINRLLMEEYKEEYSNGKE